MEDIAKILQTGAIQSDGQPSSRAFYKKGQKRKKHHPHTRQHDARQYFNELSRIVEETHRELEKSGSPIRLCVYQKGGNIFIDVLSLDKSGQPGAVYKHDISHEAFEKLVAHIKSGRGLILDADA